MGGAGSGQYPGNAGNGGGKSKKAAVNVCGTGVPIKPEGMTDEISRIWDRVYDLTSGIAYEQDSDAVEELANLLWRQGKHNQELLTHPLDESLNKQSLAIGRAVKGLLEQFGLTPRSRQVLLVPKADAAELDPLDALRAEYE